MRLPRILLMVGLVVAASGYGPSRGEEPVPAANRLRLILPPTIHAVVGTETNVYFDNLVLTTRSHDYAFDVVCGKGRQQAERWTFTPEAGDVGRHALEVIAYDEQNQVVGRAACTVDVVAADGGSARRIGWLAVGDSLTHASVYPQHVLERMREPGRPQLTLIGSHHPEGQPDEIRHEGYGGWTAQRFATHFTGAARDGNYRERGSPFLFESAPGRRQLDFRRYLVEVNGGVAPEFATLFLGPNDMFSATDETLEATLDTMLAHYDQLVAMILTATTDTRVGVMLPVPPAASQDAFGANYAAGQTRWQYRRNQHRLVERLLEKYAGRQAERIDVIATYCQLDCQRGYPAVDVPAAARLPTVIRRQNNGVHPSADGYRQVGDAVFAWLMHGVGSPK